MIIQAVYHVPYEGLGFIKDWIIRKGHALKEVRLFENESLLPVESFDFLIIMGGPMSVSDVNKYVWLTEEIALVRKAIANNKIILGICLGAQIIARSLNSRIYKNKHREIGWFPVYFNDKTLCRSALNNQDELVTFHWHGDAFDLPDKSVHLARSDATANQAFIYDKRILGIQFHPEVKPENISQMIARAEPDLSHDSHVQTVNGIVNATEYFDANQKLIDAWLDYLEQAVGD